MSSSSLQGFMASAAKAMARQWPGSEATYRLYVDGVFSTTTGAQDVSYHPVALHSVRQETASVRELGAAPSLLQLGDVKLEFPRADLAEHLKYAKSGDVSTSDLVVIGTTGYRVVAWESYGNGTMLRIYARRQR